MSVTPGYAVAGVFWLAAMHLDFAPVATAEAQSRCVVSLTSNRQGTRHFKTNILDEAAHGNAAEFLEVIADMMGQRAGRLRTPPSTLSFRVRRFQFATRFPMPSRFSITASISVRAAFFASSMKSLSSSKDSWLVA